MVHNECEKCPAKHFKGLDDTVCEPCFTAQTTTDDQSACICKAGYHLDYNRSSCDLCPENFYKSEPGIEECTACPDNEITHNLGETSVSSCFCGSGYGMINDVCTACPAGKKSVLDGNERYCQNCGFGFVSDIEKENDCTKCGENKMTESENSTSCVAKGETETCETACGNTDPECGDCYKNMTSCSNCEDHMTKECDAAKNNETCLDNEQHLKCDKCITCKAACDWPLRIAKCRDNILSLIHI